MVIISILRKHDCSSHLQCEEKHTLLQSVDIWNNKKKYQNALK